MAEYQKYPLSRAYLFGLDDDFLKLIWRFKFSFFLFTLYSFFIIKNRSTSAQKCLKIYKMSFSISHFEFTFVVGH